MPTLLAGKLYRKTGENTYEELVDQTYIAPAVNDALSINAATPNDIAGFFIANLETNSLSVSNNVGSGPKVEILKTGALGLHVNDGTNDVFRAYVDTDGSFGAGDIVIGTKTAPDVGPGIAWDDSLLKLFIEGTLENSNGSIDGSLKTIADGGSIKFYKRVSGVWTEFGGFSAENIMFDSADTSLSLGFNCLPLTSTGDNNIAIGHSCLQNNITGYNNIAIGQSGLQDNTTGYCNIGIGLNALSNVIASANNVAIGVEALFNQNTSFLNGQNIAIGSQSMYNSNSGFNSVAIGLSSLFSVVSSGSNTAVGYNSLFNTTSGGNTGIGASAGALISSGEQNVAVGSSSLGGVTTGSNNTGIGTGTSANTSASFVTLVGAFATYSGSNTIRMGRASTDTLRGYNYTADSDIRLKEDVETIPIGLDFIKKLRPVFYKWKDRTFVTGEERVKQKYKRKHAGFIADEVGDLLKEEGVDFGVYQDPAVALGIKEPIEIDFDNYKEPADLKGLAEQQFIPVLVKALQELSAKVEQLEAQIQALQ